MTNLTKEECQEYQDKITLFAQICNASDTELIERYLEQTRLQVDGTLDVIMPHFMSIQDMEKGKRNLKYLRAVGQAILDIKKLSAEFIQQKAA